MSKVITLAGVSILVVALILGMAVPALAAPKASHFAADFEGELVEGEVISIGDQEFVIQSGEEEVTIAVAEDTLYYQLSMPGVLAHQRLQLRQQNQEELRAQIGNGLCRGLKNRMRVAVALRNHLRLQNRLNQAARFCWLTGNCPFSEQAEFADISVGDNVLVLTIDGVAKVVVFSPAS